jgi:tRNA (guanine-N7-)-methyltransferase
VRSRQRLSIEQLTPFLLPQAKPGESAPTISWTSLFGNYNPVEMEIGFGKGMFLLSAATSQPNVNFLGVEIDRKYALYAATRFAIRQLQNVRVACTDARELLRDRIPKHSVQKVHIYFPDPWWKKRHHKRRLFTTGFIASVERVLKPGGDLYVVTDVAEYFTVMREIVGGIPGFADAPPPPANEPAHDLDYLTNFERKFRKEGRPIYRAAFVKKLS